jgi:hypothetical protein
VRMLLWNETRLGVEIAMRICMISRAANRSIRRLDLADGGGGSNTGCAIRSRQQSIWGLGPLCLAPHVAKEGAIA